MYNQIQIHMRKDYKIVVVTAAGRRRYMQYLVPFVIASDVVDRYDIWVNTHNGADIEFFKQLADKYPKINLVWQPDGIVDGIKSINAFYKGCIDEKSIYFKLDDDIPWMEPNAIEKMVDFRIDNPDYFLVSPIVINNALSTYLLQLHNKIKLNTYYNSNASHRVLWESGDFASQLHQWFINNYLVTQKWDKLHIPPTPVAMTRFSINAILWFGKDMKAIDGIIPGDDEEFLSAIYPSKISKPNCWNGDVIMAHFAFFTQREQLDKDTILEKYGDYLGDIWTKDPKMNSIHSYVQEIMFNIKENESILMSHPSPYKRPDIAKSPKSNWVHRIPIALSKHTPILYRHMLKLVKGKPQPTKYIIE